MKILINPDLARKATYLTSAIYLDKRRYYELNDCLIVTRNGLDLPSLAGAVVDAKVGWDVAQPGFTADENRLGERRTKITIYRRLQTRYDKRLSDLIEVDPN